MKYFILAFSTCFFSQFATATPDFKHWVDQDSNTVYYLNNAKVKVEITKLEVDDNYYAQLAIFVDFFNHATDNELVSLKSNYPEYRRFLPVAINSRSTAVVEFLKANLTYNLTSLPSSEGFYYHMVLNYITKKQYLDITKNMNENSINIDVSVGIEIAKNKTLEKKSLSKSTCYSLTKDGNSLYEVMQNYSKILSSVDKMSFTYKQTQQSLSRSILVDCLDFASSKKITSFSELLDTTASLKNDLIAPYGVANKTYSVKRKSKIQSEVEFKLFDN